MRFDHVAIAGVFGASLVPLLRAAGPAIICGKLYALNAATDANAESPAAFPTPPNLETVQEDFKTKTRIWEGAAPFNSDDSFSSTHTDSLFDGFTAVHSRVFIAWMLDSPSTAAAGAGNFLTGTSTRRATKVAGSLTKADMEHIRDLDACANMGHVMHWLTSSALEGVDAGCLRSMLTTLNTKHPDKLSNFDALKGKPYGMVIVQVLGPNIAKLKTSQLGEIFTQPEACEALTNADLVALATTAEKAQTLEAECMKVVPFTELANPIKGIENFGADVFSLYPSAVGEGNFVKMPAAMVKQFSANRPSGFICEHMKPDKLTTENIKGYTPECHRGVVKNQTGSISMLWDEAPDTIHSKFSEADNFSFLTRYRGQSGKEPWTDMKMGALKDLLKVPRACDHIHKDAFNRTGIVVSPECAVRINAKSSEAMVRILLKGLYTSEVMSMFTDSNIAAWSHDSSSGLGILNHVTKEIGELIAKMGTKNEGGTHPCASIKSFEHLKSATKLQEHMTEDCMRAILAKIKIEPEQYKELKPRVADMRPFEELTREWKEEDYKSLTASRAEVLVKNGSMCRMISVDRINNDLKDEVLGVFTSECFLANPNLKQVDEKRYPHFNKTVLSKATAKDADKIKLQATSVDQYVHASADVPITEHIATTFTETTYGNLSMDKLKATPSRHLQASPPEAFKGFNESRWPELKPEALTDVDLDHIKHVPEAALIKTTAKQIAQLGKNVSNKAQDPLAIFTDKVQGKMVPDAKKAIKMRRSDAGPTASPATFALLAITVVVAVLIPAI